MVMMYILMLCLYLLIIYMLWNNFDNLEKMLCKVILFLLIVISTNLIHQTAFANDIKYIQGKAKVIDGDTIEIHGEKIRLVCIDTPESYYKGKIQYCLDNETDCGFLAKLALWNMLKNEQVICEYTKRDMYGRILGMCRKNLWHYDSTNYTTTYNYRLIEEGYAWYYNSGKECKSFKPAFEEAQKLGFGLFHDSIGGFKEPKLWRKTKTND